MGQNSFPNETGHSHEEDLPHCADQSGSTEVCLIPTAAVWTALDAVLWQALSQTIAVAEQRAPSMEDSDVIP